jgi:hypothetical protein
MGLVLCLAATGCGGGGSASTGPSSAPGSATTDPSPSTSATPSTPAVSPATGITLKLPRISINAPKGWTRAHTMAPWQKGAADFLSMLTVMDPGGNEMVGLDDLARVSRASLRKGERLHRAPDVTVGGTDMYHLAGASDKYLFHDEYGVAYLGSVVTILIDLDKAIPANKREHIRESILASVTWH